MGVISTPDYKEFWETLQRVLEDTDTIPMEESIIVLKLMYEIRTGELKL